MKKSVRASVLAAVLICSSRSLWAQNELLDLYSPLILAGGASAASIASPEASVLNPAASGPEQRLTIEGSYIGLAGLGSASGWGNVANAGITVPAPFGVISGSVHMLSSDFPSIDVDTLAAFNVSIAKDLFPGLYVGAGLGYQTGADWGLGLDVGLLGTPGNIGFLKDFRWGIAMRGIGKGYSPDMSSGVGSAPPAFTPDLGVSATLLKQGLFAFSLAPDLSFPSLQDVRFVLGARFAYSDMVFLDIAYDFGLNDAVDRTARPFPLSFGLSVKVKGDTPASPAFMNGGDITATSVAAPLKDGVTGFGLGANLAFGRLDRNPPAIKLGSTETAYISPGTTSSQGELLIPLAVTDERYVSGYRLIVKNAQGTAVRTIEAADRGPSSKGLANLRDRLLAVKRSIMVPQNLAWDGKDDNGARVPDGTYSYTVEAWDDNNNLARTSPLAVVVDTTAPAASASAAYLEFSPSGEGTKGVLPITQSGSGEDLWIGTIYDSSRNEVRQFRWSGGSPKSFEWNGKDSGGRLVPDGTYSYRVTSTDRAGNTGSALLEGIVVNTQATPVSLSTNLPAFSPNGDGIKDVLAFLPEVKVTSGMEKWTLSVRDAGGSRRTFAGGATVPASIEFDGKDDLGVRLPEGTYWGSLTVVYRNGHTPTADSSPILLRVTAPSATVSAAYRELSPDGVGTRTVLPVRQSGSSEELWQGSITSSAGRLVRSWSWMQSAPRSFEWDGRDATGRLAPDGTYSYRVTSTDAAGNTGSAALDGIVINTVPTPVALAIDNSAFSPNGDGVRDTLRFSLVVPVGNGVEKWSLRVSDQSRKVRRSFAGLAGVPASVDFDGKDDDGVALPQGTYTADLAVSYANGHEPADTSPPFVIDVTPPTATVTSDYSVFSPVGEGARNLLTFSQGVSKDAEWTGVVRSAAGQAVRTVKWSGKPDAQFAFDGHADDGSLLPDGGYTYVLSGTDRAGNSGQSGALAFQIDTRATPVIVTTDLVYFSPNGDGVKDSVRIIPSLKVATDVESFELRIATAQGAVVRRVAARNAAPAVFAWDGRDDAGAIVPDGQYGVELDVLYRNGNRPVARTGPIFVDTVFPSLTIAADTMLFSPTGDSTLKAVSIRQVSSDEDRWDGRIYDAGARLVRTYVWRGKAPDFAWDGTDDKGNTVADGVYSYAVSATDRAGNTTARTLSPIRVDSRSTPVSVRAASDGLSPNGDGVRDTIGFNLSVGVPDGIKGWTLSIVDTAGSALKVFAGASPVPESIFWDGKTDSGSAPNGTYYARLEVDYLKGNKPVARTASFILSVAPPRVTLDAGPLPFSPDGDGYNDSLRIAISAADPSPIESWNITVLDPMDHTFADWSGKGAPPGAITWDGLSAYGELVQAADDYTLVATVKDELGNVGTIRQKVPIDVLVMREDGKLRIRISSITFKADTPDYVDVPGDRLDLNMRTLGRLAEIFKRYSQYKITIEGYAVMVYWNDPAMGKQEQEGVLIPLSKARAEAVKSGLVKLGIDAGRITTVGLGGVSPIVPFGDLENRWKDRRVEFLLVR